MIRRHSRTASSGNKITRLDVSKNKKLTAKGGIIDADKGVKIIKK